MTLPGRAHIQALSAALPLLDTTRLQAWGHLLAKRLPAGGRLLVAGNGGSAAEAQHLTSELVGRFRAERAPLSAIALHADTSSVTAITNDYGPDEVFARQVRAPGMKLRVAISRGVLSIGQGGWWGYELNPVSRILNSQPLGSPQRVAADRWR